MMDLGSLICHHKKPKCLSCPLKNECNYHKIEKGDIIKSFIKKPFKKKIGINFLIICHKNFILLHQQTIQKFWKSLFFFPICYFSITDNSWKNIKDIQSNIFEIIPPFIHYFSNITLYITTSIIFIQKKRMNRYSQKRNIWYDIYNPAKIGIPSPVSKIIKVIKKHGNNIMKKIKSRTIFCSYLKKNTLGLDYQFYPGEIGRKIYNEISQEAWQYWIKKQTKIINEKKLNMFLENDRKKLEKEMIKFLF